jgi:hypothetical protein
MSASKLKSDIPDEVIESLARTILPSIMKYFESEEGQREFAEWQRQKRCVKAVRKSIQPK